MIEKILLQGTLTFLAVLAMVRVLGLRPDAFRLILVVTLGSVLASSLIDPRTSWATAIGTCAWVVVLQAALTWTANRVPAIARWIRPEPLLLLEDGHLHRFALDQARVPEADVHTAIRKAGLGDLAEVAAVVLEPDGHLAVIPRAALGDGSAIAGLAGHAAREHHGPRYLLQRKTRANWRAGLLGGLTGAAAMLLYASVAFGYLGAGTWVPYYALAARLDFPGPVVLAVELLIQLGLGSLWGLAYAGLIGVVGQRSWSRDALLGLAFGLAVYAVMGLIVGASLVPAMRALVPTHFLFGHLVFGLVTALVAASMQPRARVTITFAPRAAAVREEAER